MVEQEGNGVGTAGNPKFGCVALNDFRMDGNGEGRQIRFKQICTSFKLRPPRNAYHHIVRMREEGRYMLKPLRFIYTHIQRKCE